MNKHLLAATPAILVTLLAYPAAGRQSGDPPPRIVPPVVEGAAPVTVEKVTVHGASLAGNLEGNAADRDLIVYLPPSYAEDTVRRYPVVYALHGYTIDNDIWATEIKTPQTIEGAFALGTPEMIVVLPDSRTLHNGSMYSSSVTTGDWEGFIADDVVSWVDVNFRTLPDRASRGLVGHSMGGYGAARIGMKRPDVFGSLYIMSPCCMSPRGAPSAEILAALDTLETPEASTELGFLQRATLAVASAWSPNPDNPPFYADLPTGDRADDVLARWAANAPLSMVHQYVFSLKRYAAIALDVGDRDGLRVDTRELHDILSTYGIANKLEIYDGDHVSAVADRFQNHVMPFFGDHLAFD